MKQYLDLVQSILDTGSWQENRTGIRTLSMPGASLRFDLQQGFPAVTTKKLAFKSAIGELVGFLRARSAAEFRELGCKVWDQNANENAQWLANPYREGPDDLGPVYGVQWRQWPAYRCSTPVVRRRSPTPWRAAMPRSRTWTKAALPRCCSTRPSTSCASAWTRSMSAPATAASCSTAGTGPRSRKWRCRPATCSISSCRTPARARSRCACTSAPTTSAWARPST